MRDLRRHIQSGNIFYVFDAAGRLESFARAATELNVTPAAVSHAIRQLEAGLGFPVFVRGHRQLSLTSEGRQLYEAISSGLDAVEETVAQINAERAAAVVRVYAPITIGTYWLLPRLTAYPSDSMRIEMQLYNSDQTLELPDDGLSFAITNGRTEWPGYEINPFAREIISPVCSPSYLKEHGAISSVAEFKKHRLLHLDNNYHDGITWNDFLRHFGVLAHDEPEGLTHNNYILVIHAVLTGAGVALGWHHAAGELLKRGTLVRALDLDFDTGSVFYIVYKKGNILHPNAITAIDWLIELEQSERLDG